MRSLPPELEAEHVKENVMIFDLITITISATDILRWTDCDQDIYYLDDRYYAMSPTVDGVSYSIHPDVLMATIQVENVSKAISDRMLTTEIRDKDVQIDQVAINKSLTVIATPQIILNGFIDSAKATRQKATITIADEFIKWTKKIPGRLHTPGCPLVFKETRCGYAGAETWCDQTWERCLALSNTLNYRGFRWCSELVCKDFWWGSKQKPWTPAL